MKLHAPFFDRLCGLAERWIPEIDPWLRQTRLFVFEQRSFDFVHPTMTEDEVNFLNETFFLPFPVVAVEDPASVVLLADSQPDARGVGTPRAFIELMDQRSEGFREDHEGTIAREAFKDATLVLAGTVSMTAKAGGEDMIDAAGGRTGFNVRGTVGRVWWFDGDPRTAPPHVIEHHELPVADTGVFLRNPATAIEEIWATNLPSMFVVESSPRRSRDPTTAKKVPRSHERPVYTMLTPQAIRRQYIPSDGAPAGRKVGAHERRRHYRTLRSDRFTKMQGKTITIPATWVGPTEAKVGNRTYRVMLDL